mmetsp:Transcript_49367/g.97666  ORF Transcript_49367/g.97666 Transcript_49367/m.97666 type:complete len:231 (+) Transcript_49367:77-769(+)
MKYLENLALENLTKSITNRELGGGLVVHGRVETYSTKKAGDDKKQSKLLESKFADNINGDVSKPDVTLKTKKVLGDLIQTMNCSMVDYDFSELSPDSFAQVPMNEAVQCINSYLAEITVSSPSFINDMWRDISESMVSLAQCEVYKLVDGSFIDEVESGTVWSFNYFFCSKELKRVLYFTCMATSKYRKMDVLGMGDGDSDEEDDDIENEPMDTSDGHDNESEEEEDMWA